VFGGTVPHLHVHLAPRVPGVLCHEMVHAGHPLLSEEELRAVAERAAAILASQP
jgi:diadenosine tetraphosphate (Ap4A) HIT family hydrolase